MIRPRLALCALVLSFVAPVTAFAGPINIGAFSWEPDFGFGPVFTVQNLPGSAGDFAGVLLTLTFADATEQVIDLGLIDEGASAQSSDDLSSSIIDIATLSFTFVVPGTGVTLPGDIAVDALRAEGDTRRIDFIAAELPPEPVPEPSSLFLLASAVCGFGVDRAFRRQARV